MLSSVALTINNARIAHEPLPVRLMPMWRMVIINGMFSTFGKPTQTNRLRCSFGFTAEGFVVVISDRFLPNFGNDAWMPESRALRSITV